MKIIKIERCSECKWWDWDWCYHPSIQTDENDARAIPDSKSIPSWCPLEELPDAVEVWTVAQLLPGEGMENGIQRIEDLFISEIT